MRIMRMIISYLRLLNEYKESKIEQLFGRIRVAFSLRRQNYIDTNHSVKRGIGDS